METSTLSKRRQRNLHNRPRDDESTAERSTLEETSTEISSIRQPLLEEQPKWSYALILKSTLRNLTCSISLQPTALSNEDALPAYYSGPMSLLHKCALPPSFILYADARCRTAAASIEFHGLEGLVHLSATITFPASGKTVKISRTGWRYRGEYGVIVSTTGDDGEGEDAGTGESKALTVRGVSSYAVIFFGMQMFRSRDAGLEVFDEVGHRVAVWRNQGTWSGQLGVLDVFEGLERREAVEEALMATVAIVMVERQSYRGWVG